MLGQLRILNDDKTHARAGHMQDFARSRMSIDEKSIIPSGFYLKLSQSLKDGNRVTLTEKNANI